MASQYTIMTELLAKMTATQGNLEDLAKNAANSRAEFEARYNAQFEKQKKMYEEYIASQQRGMEKQQKAFTAFIEKQDRRADEKEKEDKVGVRFGLTNALVVTGIGIPVALFTSSFLTTGIAVLTTASVVLGIQTATGKVFYKQISRLWKECCGKNCECSTCCDDKSTLYKNEKGSNSNSRSLEGNKKPENGSVQNNTCASVIIDIDSKEGKKREGLSPTAVVATLPNIATTSTAASVIIPLETHPVPEHRVDIKVASDTPPEPSQTTQTIISSSISSASSPTHNKNEKDSPHPKSSPVLGAAVVPTTATMQNTYFPSGSSTGSTSRTKALTATTSTAGNMTARGQTPSRSNRNNMRNNNKRG